MNGEGRIGESERWLSVILGGMLVLSSLRRRDATSGALFALSGAALLYRGIRGEEGFFRALARTARDSMGVERAGPSSRIPAGEPGGVVDAWDEVDEASAESFPASDAPAWTPTSGLANEEH